jgi:ABC-type uncharacterized transport system substrate-binding protein
MMNQRTIFFVFLFFLPAQALACAVQDAGQKIALLSPLSMAPALCVIKNSFLSLLTHAEWPIDEYELDLNTNTSTVCQEIAQEGYDLIVTMGGKCLKHMCQACIEVGLTIPILTCGAINDRTMWNIPADYPVTGVTEGANFKRHFDALCLSASPFEAVVIPYSNLTLPGAIAKWQAIIAAKNIACLPVLIEATDDLVSKVAPYLTPKSVVLVLKDHVVLPKLKILHELCQAKNIIVCASDAYSAECGDADLAYGVVESAFAVHLIALIERILFDQVAANDIPVVDLEPLARMRGLPQN